MARGHGPEDASSELESRQRPTSNVRRARTRTYPRRGFIHYWIVRMQVVEETSHYVWHYVQFLIFLFRPFGNLSNLSNVSNVSNPPCVTFYTRVRGCARLRAVDWAGREAGGRDVQPLILAERNLYLDGQGRRRRRRRRRQFRWNSRWCLRRGEWGCAGRAGRAAHVLGLSNLRDVVLGATAVDSLWAFLLRGVYSGEF
jgi:hypothetical protein